MNRPFKLNRFLLQFLIAFSLLPFIFSCNSGIEKARKSAEAAKEAVGKSGAYNFFPGKYKKALNLMKKAGNKTKKQELEKAGRFYDMARKKLLEINGKGENKKSSLEESIQSVTAEIDTAKEKAKASIDAINDSCVSDISGKVLGKTSSAKSVVLKYFDKLKNKAQSKIKNAEEQLTKVTELQGDDKLKKKNRKLKSILETYTTASQIADEICKKTESSTLKAIKKKSKPAKEKKKNRTP